MPGAVTVGQLVLNLSANTDGLTANMSAATGTVQSSAQTIVNSWAGVTAGAAQATDAGARLIKSLQDEIATFGMTSQELLLHKAALNGVGDEADSLITRLNAMRSAQEAMAGAFDVGSGATRAQADAVAQLADADALATARIRDMVAASLAEAAAIEEVAVAADVGTAAQTRLGNSIAQNTAASRNWQQNMAGVDASMKGAGSSAVALSADTQKILDKYDPLGTKMRSLQADLATLQKSMGNSVSPAAIKAFQGLEDEISATGKLMETAGVDGFTKSGQAAGTFSLASAGATRELIVLGREAISGDFSRMPGSFLLLAQRMGAMGELLNPLTIGIAAVAAATVGLVAAAEAGHDEFVQMNNALLATSNYSGQTRDSIALLENDLTKTGEVTIGMSKQIVTALVSSGQIGGQALGVVAGLASDFAKSTNQDIGTIAPKLVQLFANPLQGAEELNKSMNFLTQTDIDHIATLVNLGLKQQAQLELAQKLADFLPKQAANVTLLGSATNNLADAFSLAGAALKGFMATSVPVDDFSKKLQSAQAYLDTMIQANHFGQYDAQIKAASASLDKMVADHQAVTAVATATGAAASSASDLQNAAIKEVNKSQLTQIQNIKDEQTLLASAPDSDDKTQRAIELTKQLQAAYAALSADQRAATTEQISNQEALDNIGSSAALDQIATLQKLGQISKQQYDEQATDIKVNMLDEQAADQLKLANMAGLTAQQKQDHLDQMARLQAEIQLALQQGGNAVTVDNHTDYQSMMDAMQKADDANMQSITEQIAKEQQRGLEIGKTKEQVDQLKASQAAQSTEALQQQAKAITLLLQQDDLINNPVATGIYTQILGDLNDQIAAQQQLGTVMASNAVTQANADAAKKASEAWKHTATEISDDLTSAIIDGGGKGWKKLVTDMETAFAKMVLQPILAPISSTIASIINPSAPQASATSDVAGISSLINTANAAKTAYSALTSTGSGSISAWLSGTSSVSPYAQASANMTGMTGGDSLGALINSQGWSTGAESVGSEAAAGSAGTLGGGSAASGLAGGTTIDAAGDVIITNAGTDAATSTGAAIGADSLGGAAAEGGADAAAADASTMGPYGWVAAAAILVGGLLMGGSGKEQNTGLTFADDNAPGNISINERGNQGQNNTAYLNSAAGSPGANGAGASSAFGTFGVSASFWSPADSAAVTSLMTNVATSDDAIASLLTNGEKSNVITALQGHTYTTASLGAEGTDQNASGQLDAVFKDHINTILDAVQPGLSKLEDGFVGTQDQLATEVEQLLKFRTALQTSSTAVFGAQVTLEDLAALKEPTEATSAALTRVTSEFTDTNAVATSLGKDAATAFGAVGLASEATRAQLVTLSGGLDQLNTNTTFYIQNFLSQQQQLAPVVTAVDNAMEALGYTGVTTKAQFEQIVDGLNLATAAGQQTYASLMQLAPAFVQAYGDSTDLNNQLDLQSQIYAATGDAAGAAAVLEKQHLIALQGLSPATAALTQQLWDAQAAQTAQAAAASDSSAILDQQSQLYAATGDAAGAAAVLEKQHEAALVGLSPALAAATQATWDAQAAATATTSKLSIQAQIFAATGNAAGAAAVLEQQHLAALQQLSPAMQDLTEQLWAAQAAADVTTKQDALNSAYQSQESAMQGVIDKLQSFEQNIANLKTSLAQGDLSTLSPADKLAEAKATYESTLAAAQGGDTTAQGQLSQDAQAYLTADKAYNASNAQYAKDEAGVQSDLSKLYAATGTQISTDQQQLNAMTTQVTQLVKIDDTLDAGFIKVEQAIADLATSLQAQAVADNAVGATTAGASSSAAAEAADKSVVDALYQQYLVRAPDTPGENFWINALMTGTTLASVIQGFLTSPEYLADHSHANGGIASGPSLVGENGPEMVDFAQPARVYTASQTAGMLAPQSSTTDPAVTKLLAQLLESSKADKLQMAALSAQLADQNKSMLAAQAKLDRAVRSS